MTIEEVKDRLNDCSSKRLCKECQYSFRGYPTMHCEGYMIEEISQKVAETEEEKAAEMKTKCKVCTVMRDISRGNELRACAFENNGDENICPFDARYLDLSEHDKQVRADAINECIKVNHIAWERYINDYSLGKKRRGQLNAMFVGILDMLEELKEQK